ncbi:hypothetical protein [Halolamina sp. C58]
MSLPKETAERLGMEQGDDLELAYDPTNDEFRVRRASDFEGWD